MCFIDRLEEAAFARPLFLSLVPKYTGEVTLLDHELLFLFLTILVRAQHHVHVNKFSQVLVISNRESELYGCCQVLYFNFFNAHVSHRFVEIVKVDLKHIDSDIVCVIKLVRIHGIFNGLCNIVLTQLDT